MPNNEGAQRALSPQLVALISQVELAKSDWWRTALRETALLAVWLSDGPQDAADVPAAITATYGIRVEQHEVEEALTDLIATGDLVDLGDRRCKVSEAMAARLINRIEDHERTDRLAADHFVQVFETRCADFDADDAWPLFNESLLGPLIHQLGARTHQFLQGKPFDLKSSALMRSFLRRFPKEVRPAVEDAVLDFLDPSSPAVRAYVVDRLTTYSFVQASRWPRELLDEVLKLGGERPTFVVFLDTNLLFSMLKLHENPANEAACALDDLRGHLAGLVDLKLYITADTIKEARESLLRAEQRMRGVVLTPEVVRGTSHVRFNGLARRFIEQAAAPGGLRDPASYFGHYADNLLAHAREHEIELYNADLSDLHVDQQVIDDMELATKVEKKRQLRRRKGRLYVDKSYEQLLHDVVLWHFVVRKRAPYVESPLQARYWIVTVDYSLLGFDAHKSQLSSSRRRTPLCLHPTALIQMLRFWVPRGAELDAAVVRSLRLPFLSMEFDAELEQATIRILQTISRFENAESLSESTILALVTNDELRRRMGPDSSPQQREAALHAAFLDQEAALQEQLQRATSEAADARREKSVTGEEVATLRQQLNEVQQELKAKQSAPASEAAPTAAPARPTQRSEGSVLRIILFAIASLVLLALPLTLVTWIGLRLLPARLGAVAISAVVVVGVGAALHATVLVTRRLGTDDDRRKVQSLAAFHKWWWIGVVSTLAVGVAAPLLTESMRRPDAGAPTPTPSATITPVRPPVGPPIMQPSPTTSP